jgi:hypothetical protein
LVGVGAKQGCSRLLLRKLWLARGGLVGSVVS